MSISHGLLSLGILTVVLTSLLYPYRSTLGQATNNNFVMYDNPNFGIKIQYPADWAKEKTDDEFGKGVIFLVPGSPIKYAEKLSIDILDNNDGKSLADKVNDLIDFNQHKNDALTNYQVIEPTPIVVNNIPAYKIVDTYTDPDNFGNQFEIISVVDALRLVLTV